MSTNNNGKGRKGKSDPNSTDDELSRWEQEADELEESRLEADRLAWGAMMECWGVEPADKPDLKVVKGGKSNKPSDKSD